MHLHALSLDMTQQSIVYVPFGQAEKLKSDLHTWYGFPMPFLEQFRYWQRPDSLAVAITPRDFEPPADLPFEALGMLLLRSDRDFRAVSTAFIRKFGHLATVRVLRPAGEALEDYLHGRTRPWPDEDPASRSFVLVMGKDGPLGRAIWRFIDGQLHLESELPKQYRPGVAIPLDDELDQELHR